MNADWKDSPDPQGPDDADLPDGEADSSSATIPCPHCGMEVYEDSPRCSSCHQYITRTGGRRPLWVAVVAVLAVAALVAWLLAR